MLYHVVAVAKNGVIGHKNQLPWHFSADLKHFKKLTMGSTVIMGRKTYESIGKPLPGRQNRVITQSGAVKSGGLNGTLRVFGSIEDALLDVDTKDAYIIGGATLYQETLDRVDGIIMTRIHAEYEGDVFYPRLPGDFKETQKTWLQDNPLLEVVVYERHSN